MLKIHRTNGTFGLPDSQADPFAKPKEPFFANAATDNKSNIFYIEKRDR